MSGAPVTIVTSGGIAVTPVESGAPVMTVAESGGIAVTIVESGGMPFVVEGLNPPTEVPVNTSAPEIREASLTVGDSPTWRVGTWTNGPITARRFQLYANGVAIDGATSSGGYALQASEEGAQITVGEIATNVIGDSDEAVSAAVGPVAMARPGDINDLTATATSDTEVSLVWTPATNAASHEYRVDGGAWTAAGNGSQTVSGLTPETSYDFQVRGVNAYGAGNPSNTASATTEAAPVTNAMTFVEPGDHSNVDLANSSVVDAESDTPQVTLRVQGVSVETEHGGNVVWGGAFIEVDGCNGKTPTFTLPNTGYRWTNFITSLRLLWSYDGRTWQAFDSETGDGTVRICSNNEPFTQSRVVVSSWPSIRATDRAYFAGQIAALAPDRFRLLPNATDGAALIIPGGRVGVSGQVIPDLPVLGAQIEDFSSTLPKRTFVVTTANHPGEDQAEHAALGFLRQLVQDDWLVARIRVLFYWLNPPGQYGGSYRTSFEGTEPGGNPALANDDTNRGWTSEPSPLSDIQAYKERLLSDVAALGLSEVDGFFDMHGSPYTDRMYTFAGPDGITDLEYDLGTVWSDVRPGFYIQELAAAAGTASVAWAGDAIAPGLSYSTENGSGWGATSEEDYAQFGAELVEVLKRALNGGLFPTITGDGVFRARMDGAAGVFASTFPNVTSAARGAWSI